MMTGTNWIVSVDDYHAYRNGGDHAAAALPSSSEGEKSSTTAAEGDVVDKLSTIQSILLALATPTGIFHTIIVAFFLVNVIYNYYQCVTTSNSGKLYDVVVREIAKETSFDYPETEEELIQCKRNLERKIASKLEGRRRELMAAAAATQNNNSSNNGDEETANTQQNNTPQQPIMIPRIHHWQLLTPTEWSYCRFSKQPKPSRSHYDHVTKSLVLNMDHYCPWMFNCVGYANYRFFLNFLFFTTTGLGYGAVICLRPFLNLSGSEYREQVKASGAEGVALSRALRGVTSVRHLESNSYIPTPNERTSVALGFMICLCLCCAVGCLLGFHLYLTLSAQTTIEFHGNWAKRRKKKGWKNPYSAGNWKRNWEMIYGTRYHHVENSADTAVERQDHQHSYRGCWGMLMAMMPSKREPEFLPFPFDGVLIRRQNRVNACVEVDKKVDEEMAQVESPLLSSWDQDNVDDDVVGLFKKKPQSSSAADILVESNNSYVLTDRAGRNLPRGEELMV